MAWAPLIERMRARGAAMEVKGLASQWACTVYSSHASWWACAFEDSLHASRSTCASDGARMLPFSQGQAAVRTAPPTTIKTKTHGITWMVNKTYTVWIIQTFEILKWQLFFQNAFVGCHYSSAPSLKMDTKNTTSCPVPFHDSMPSFMNFRRVLELLEFKKKVSQCFAGNQRCPGVWNSFPFLACDLSMHQRTQISFSTNYMH